MLSANPIANITSVFFVGPNFLLNRFFRSVRISTSSKLFHVQAVFGVSHTRRSVSQICKHWLTFPGCGYFTLDYHTVLWNKALP